MSLNFTKIDGYQMTEVMVSSYRVGAIQTGSITSPRDAASGQRSVLIALLLP